MKKSENIKFSRLGFRQLSVAVAIRLIVIGWLCPACSIDDDRDLCCLMTNAMRYVYTPHGKDEFSDHIFSLRHYLFDESGNFLHEVMPGENLQLQPLTLEEGRYTLITLGNYAKSIKVNSEEFPPLSGFNLLVDNISRKQDEAFENVDELFWGIRHFDLDRRGYISDYGPERHREDYNTPVTEMNNIHCHLSVRVEWNNLPDYIGDYEMELSGVPTGYILDPGAVDKAGGYLVPSHNVTGVHRLNVPLDGMELQGEFVTLRYTDTAIPTLRIFFADKQVSPDINLRVAFRKWGWYPSQIHVQEYSIVVRLYSDGRAEVSPEFEGTVCDWINGGLFS